MKIRTLIAMTACGGTLILCSTAHAEFLGIQIVDVSQWFSTIGPPNPLFRIAYNAEGGPAAYQIYRIFAMFDDSGEAQQNNRVNSTFGSPGNPWALAVGSGSVYNFIDTFSKTPEEFWTHFNLAPSPATTFHIHQGWETWATIGTQYATNPQVFSAGAHDASQLNNFRPDFSADNASLYITPDDTQGRAIALNNTTTTGMGHTGFGVLLMQITVTTGSVFDGQFNLNIGAAGSTQDVLGLTFGAVPAPGALALFGLAALMGNRRRRM